MNFQEIRKQLDDMQALSEAVLLSRSDKDTKRDIIAVYRLRAGMFATIVDKLEELENALCEHIVYVADEEREDNQ